MAETTNINLKQKLIGAIVAEVNFGFPRKSDVITQHLYSLFAWQTLAKHASDMYDRCWEAARKAGAVPTDDALRKLGEGEHIALESAQFSLVAKNTKPHESLDLDKFVFELCKKYRLKPDPVFALAEKCKKQSVPPLSKRVLEVAA